MKDVLLFLSLFFFQLPALEICKIMWAFEGAVVWWGADARQTQWNVSRGDCRVSKIDLEERQTLLPRFYSSPVFAGGKKNMYKYIFMCGINA